jgi:hypothetical protein
MPRDFFRSFEEYSRYITAADRRVEDIDREKALRQRMGQRHSVNEPGRIGRLAQDLKTSPAILPTNDIMDPAKFKAANPGPKKTGNPTTKPAAKTSLSNEALALIRLDQKERLHAAIRFMEQRRKKQNYRIERRKEKARRDPTRKPLDPKLLVDHDRVIVYLKDVEQDVIEKKIPRHAHERVGRPEFDYIDYVGAPDRQFDGLNAVEWNEISICERTFAKQVVFTDKFVCEVIKLPSIKGVKLDQTVPGMVHFPAHLTNTVLVPERWATMSTRNKQAINNVGDYLSLFEAIEAMIPKERYPVELYNNLIKYIKTEDIRAPDSRAKLYRHVFAEDPDYDVSSILVLYYASFGRLPDRADKAIPGVFDYLFNPDLKTKVENGDTWVWDMKGVKHKVAWPEIPTGNKKTKGQKVWDEVEAHKKDLTYRIKPNTTAQRPRSTTSTTAQRPGSTISTTAQRPGSTTSKAKGPKPIQGSSQVKNNDSSSDGDSDISCNRPANHAKKSTNPYEQGVRKDDSEDEFEDGCQDGSSEISEGPEKETETENEPRNVDMQKMIINSFGDESDGDLGYGDDNMGPDDQHGPREPLTTRDPDVDLTGENDDPQQDIAEYANAARDTYVRIAVSTELDDETVTMANGRIVVSKLKSEIKGQQAKAVSAASRPDIKRPTPQQYDELKISDQIAMKIPTDICIAKGILQVPEHIHKWMIKILEETNPLAVEEKSLEVRINKRAALVAVLRQLEAMVQKEVGLRKQIQDLKEEKQELAESAQIHKTQVQKEMAAKDKELNDLREEMSTWKQEQQKALDDKEREYNEAIKALTDKISVEQTEMIEAHEIEVDSLREEIRLLKIYQEQDNKEDHPENAAPSKEVDDEDVQSEVEEDEPIGGPSQNEDVAMMDFGEGDDYPDDPEYLKQVIRGLETDNKELKEKYQNMAMTCGEQTVEIASLRAQKNISTSTSSRRGSNLKRTLGGRVMKPSTATSGHLDGKRSASRSSNVPTPERQE